MLGVLGVLLLCGCNRDEGKLRAQAEWLCRYNQLESLNLQSFPAEVKPAEYVRQEDVEYLRQQDAAAGDNALAQGMLAALGPAVMAITEGMAKHTACEVSSIAINGEAATLSVKSTRPELEKMEIFGKLGELAKADTKDARLAKVEEWIKASTKSTTTTHTLAFVKTPEGWRANYDLKAKAEEKKRAQALAEIQELTKKKLAAEKARADLAKFSVIRSRFRQERQMFGTEPIIELSVKNDTGHAVSRVFMRGTLASPGRSVPWLRETFNYSISGGIEPGEAADWALSLNMFSEWGKVKGAPDMVLTIEVLRLDGADGKPLYTLDFDDEDQQRLSALEASLSQ
jgi:hypothetical protein